MHSHSYFRHGHFTGQSLNLLFTLWFFTLAFLHGHFGCVGQKRYGGCQHLFRLVVIRSRGNHQSRYQVEEVGRFVRFCSSRRQVHGVPAPSLDLPGRLHRESQGVRQGWCSVLPPKRGSTAGRQWRCGNLVAFDSL